MFLLCAGEQAECPPGGADEAPERPAQGEPLVPAEHVPALPRAGGGEGVLRGHRGVGGQGGPQREAPREAGAHHRVQRQVVVHAQLRHRLQGHAALQHPRPLRKLGGKKVRKFFEFRKS